MRFLSFFVLAFLLNDDDLAKKDFGSFQGNWQLVSMVRGGKEMPKEEVRKITLKIDGNTFVLRREGKVLSEGEFKLDPTKRPKQIDEILTAGPSKGKTFRAIYEIDDRSHRICFAGEGKERPTAFSSPPGSGQVNQVWRRVED